MSEWIDVNERLPESDGNYLCAMRDDNAPPFKATIDEFWSGLEKLSMFKGKEKPTLEELLEYIEQVKVEAYKEFAERLKCILTPYPDCHFCEPLDSDVLDNLLAELTGETVERGDKNE